MAKEEPKESAKACVAPPKPGMTGQHAQQVEKDVATQAIQRAAAPRRSILHLKYGADGSGKALDAERDDGGSD
jgi:hypothetical protein